MTRTPRRRRSPGLLSSLALGGAFAAAFYAFWMEPAMTMRIVRWRLTPERWRGRDPVRFVIISDLHAGWPHIGYGRVRRIVERANALKPDVAVLLGDYVAAHPVTCGGTDIDILAKILRDFTAPHGTYAIFGNHDWWQDPVAQRTRQGPIRTHRVMDRLGIDVLDNQAVRIGGERGFWLAGLGDQRPFTEGPDGEGRDDLDAAMSEVTDDAPVVLLAHEPDIFDDLAGSGYDNIVAQFSGHTHGGQIRLFGQAPLILASENEKYSWGRYDAGPHSMIVSGGIGCSVLPMRVGVPPEITVIELHSP